MESAHKNYVDKQPVGCYVNITRKCFEDYKSRYGRTCRKFVLSELSKSLDHVISMSKENESSETNERAGRLTKYHLLFKPVVKYTNENQSSHTKQKRNSGNKRKCRSRSVLSDGFIYATSDYIKAYKVSSSVNHRVCLNKKQTTKNSIVREEDSSIEDVVRTCNDLVHMTRRENEVAAASMTVASKNVPERDNDVITCCDDFVSQTSSSPPPTLPISDGSTQIPAATAREKFHDRRRLQRLSSSLTERFLPLRSSSVHDKDVITSEKLAFIEKWRREFLVKLTKMRSIKDNDSYEKKTKRDDEKENRDDEEKRFKARTQEETFSSKNKVDCLSHTQRQDEFDFDDFRKRKCNEIKVKIEDDFDIREISPTMGLKNDQTLKTDGVNLQMKSESAATCPFGSSTTNNALKNSSDISSPMNSTVDSGIFSLTDDNEEELNNSGSENSRKKMNPQHCFVRSMRKRSKISCETCPTVNEHLYADDENENEINDFNNTENEHNCSKSDSYVTTTMPDDFRSPVILQHGIGKEEDEDEEESEKLSRYHVQNALKSLDYNLISGDVKNGLLTEPDILQTKHVEYMKQNENFPYVGLRRSDCENESSYKSTMSSELKSYPKRKRHLTDFLSLARQGFSEQETSGKWDNAATIVNDRFLLSTKNLQQSSNDQAPMTKKNVFHRRRNVSDDDTESVVVASNVKQRKKNNVEKYIDSFRKIKCKTSQNFCTVVKKNFIKVRNAKCKRYSKLAKEYFDDFMRLIHQTTLDDKEEEEKRRLFYDFSANKENNRRGNVSSPPRVRHVCRRKPFSCRFIEPTLNLSALPRDEKTRIVDLHKSRKLVLEKYETLLPRLVMSTNIPNFNSDFFELECFDLFKTKIENT